MSRGALSKVLSHTGQGKTPATKPEDEDWLAGEGGGDEDDGTDEGLGNAERDE
jgi:hypothetical protein